ncbi:MAG: DEAD/DEAH box helicase [Thaumarchaeota archaeon]|nr:DEAD/DEAH box helicase [Nitrososphaerota archaeon]MDD9813074.1 DEAD/DEAH box helicase [Nitrososphaerota archaeon]MDD9842355.1 DEAD/DEAH box helicase [Nitrososphaerota archaeon]RNJ71897.1 MAG: DEAD/DEAH box helicase [Thaumarchaeota archaeon S14]RNJ73110.1 MAG: DEAD/DEAH box helicase [Thaumarchaeota archaeon S13]
MRGQGGEAPARGRAEARLAAAFASLGFARLTPIQKKASPVIAQKRDTLVIAPTGSGKTECSVVPIFARASRTRRDGRTKVLYVTPLRALNKDVFRRIGRYAESAGLTMAIRHGDTPQSARRKMAASPPDVLITTPETLVVMLSQERMLAALSELEWVVIDEVHELLPSERGAQLAISLERLELNSSRELTRVGLSATVGNAPEAAKLVSGTSRRCRIVRDRTRRRYDVDVALVEGGLPSVADEIARLAAPAARSSPVLLFTNTRGEAELLAALLRERAGGIAIDLHHGSLSRGVREESESSLREGRGGIVVCTSSLELGLDIGSVDLVMHYGSPRQVSRMAQRIGRSRHAGSGPARGIIIAPDADDYMEARAILDRAREGSMEEQPVHRGALDVIAHHLVGLALQLGEVDIGDALGLIRRAYPFRDTTLDDLMRVLDMLAAALLVSLDRKSMSFRRRARSLRYHYQNLSTIPDVLKFRVIDTATKSYVGTLDQRFVGDYGERDNIFVLRGMRWRILNVDEKDLRVNVEPHRSGGMTVPYWEGENIPVDAETARRAGAFRTRKSGTEGRVASKAMARAGFGAPDSATVVAESCRAEGAVVVHACLGTRVNATLATILSSILSAQLGRTVESRSDAYRIALSSQARITEEMLSGVLRDEYGDIAPIVQASLAGTHNVNWRSWCVAKRFGIVERGAVYDRRDARVIYERHLSTPLAREAMRELYHDKYDLAGARDALARLRDGSTSLVWADVDSFSALAEPILGRAAHRASPSSVDGGILAMVRERLMSNAHRLVCARCGAWDRLVKTSELRSAVSCPRCRARQVAVAHRADEEIAGIIRRRAAGRRLDEGEERLYRRAWKTASLLETFGQAALIALSGYGVGADTAARILRDMAGEEGIYRQVYEAERQYVMTRGFWDD